MSVAHFDARRTDDERRAANLDPRCTGTTMRDHLRASDLARPPGEIVAQCDNRTAVEGRKVVFEAEAAAPC
jgi:hypothetical protein